MRELSQVDKFSLNFSFNPSKLKISCSKFFNALPANLLWMSNQKNPEEDQQSIVEEIVDEDGEGVDQQFEAIPEVESDNLDPQLLKFFRLTKPTYAFKVDLQKNLGVVYLRKCNNRLLEILGLPEHSELTGTWFATTYLKNESLLLTGFFGGVIQVKGIYRMDILKKLAEPEKIWSPPLILGSGEEFTPFFVNIPEKGYDLIVWNVNYNLLPALKKELHAVLEEIVAFEANAQELEITRPREGVSKDEMNEYYLSMEMFNIMQTHLTDLMEKKQELKNFIEAWENFRLLD